MRASEQISLASLNLARLLCRQAGPSPATTNEVDAVASALEDYGRAIAFLPPKERPV